MLGGIKHFIWDFDGTLFDTYPFTVDCFSRALSDLGHTVDKAEIFDHMMDTIHHTFDYYAEKFSLGGRLLEKYREYAATESYRTSPPFSRAAELLKTVKETGGCNYMFTHRRADVFPFLDGTGMREAFLEIVTMENGFKAKPDPEAIQYLVDKYDMRKSETLMIGDRGIDIGSGRNAGVMTCYITNGAERKGISADIRFQNLGEMLSAMKLSKN